MVERREMAKKGNDQQTIGIDRRKEEKKKAKKWRDVEINGYYGSDTPQSNRRSGTETHWYHPARPERKTKVKKPITLTRGGKHS